MHDCFEKMGTGWKDQDRLSDRLISLAYPMVTILAPTILCGCKSRREGKVTFTAVDKNGIDRSYRLTILLDSLATSEKNDVGMNKTETATSANAPKGGENE